MEVRIKKRRYVLTVPKSTQEKLRGLSEVESLKGNEGMLFILNEGREVENAVMNTAEMKIPVVMLFVGRDKKITYVQKADPGIAEISRPDTAYVIELKEGMGLDTKGETVEFLTNQKNIIIGHTESPASLRNKMKMGGKIDIKSKVVDIIPEAMQVLDDKGNVVMNIFGGERIFSMLHTKEIIAMAEKVHTGKKDPEELGKLVSRIIKIHDTQEPQYTDY